MKRNILIFLRVIFILLVMLAATYFGLKYYYLSESKQGIEHSLNTSNAPIIGDAKAPFTIVEFFDYRCPHCYAMSKILMESIGDDINSTTKIVLRPSGVVDQQSYDIASFVLALDMQKPGETVALHKELMELPDVPTYETVKAMAGARGLNVEQAVKDADGFKGQIVENTKYMQEIGFPSVPALVIGDKGYVPTQSMPGVNELRFMMIDAKTRLQIPTN